MIVQKRLFSTPKLELEVGQSIAAAVGYETYGTVSPQRDNVILICHYFSGTSHAAGRYHADDEAPGWWDALIGPGKAFDTNRYFVIAVDSLCNINVRSPLVITTGPASVDPATGRPCGMTFPQVTIRDNVRLQKQLLDSLGIERLVCVAGPSMGGFQALEWAVTYPRAVQRVVAAISSHQCPPVFGLAVCQGGSDAIRQDPAFGTTEGPLAGLARAMHTMTVLARSDAWISGMWDRKTAVGSAHPWADAEGQYAFQAETAQIARTRAQAADPYHWVYTARACLLHDIGHGYGGLEGALPRLRARVLMLPVSSDLLFPVEASQSFVAAVTAAGGKAELSIIESPNGHLAGVYEAGRMAEPIARFLSSNHDLH